MGPCVRDTFKLNLASIPLQILHTVHDNMSSIETSHVQDVLITPFSITTQEEEEAPSPSPSPSFKLTGHFLFTTVLSMFLGLAKTLYSHKSGGPVVTVVFDWVLVFLPFM
jgi:hypothetical protein